MSTRSTKSTKVTTGKSTFTYFIPAPPTRKSGYREIEFDKIMQGILTSGFEIEELHTQSVQNGIYVIALLKARSKKTQALDANLDIQEKFRLSATPLSPDIILEEDEDEQ